MPDQSAPKPGTLWLHQDGGVYAIILVTSPSDRPKFPQTVVYENIQTGQVWPRVLSDWHRAFVLAPELTIDQLEGLCARLERELKEALDYEVAWRTCAIFSDPAPTNSWDWRDRQRRRIAEVRALIERRGG